MSVEAKAWLAQPVLPPRAEHDGTLRRLLEHALICFGEQGYHAVSIRDIARAAGVAASSIYAHVASKDQLLAELSLVAHVEHRDRLRVALLEAGSEPASQVRAFVDAHVRFHATYPLLARVANRELGALSPANHERVMAVRLDSQALLEQIVDRGKTLGVLTAPDTYLATAAIGGMGIRVAEWWTPDSPYTADEVARHYAEFAVKMLTPAGGVACP